MSAGRLLSTALRALTAASAREFRRAVADPERAQAARLRAVLRQVAGSRQAERIAGFARIRYAREFQDAVPLRGADDLARDVAEIARGTPAVLTTEPVLRFERSGGSSGASKLVPHTRALSAEFHAALLPWLHDLAVARPAFCGGPGYWSISPLAQRPEFTSGGIPIGSEDDGAYLPRALRSIQARLFAVPGAVARMPDVESCRYVTLRLLLDCPRLALISAWNPSYLTLLMNALDRDAERLLDDLAAGACRPPEPERPNENSSTRLQAIHAVLRHLDLPPRAGRALELRAALGREGRLEPRTLWPRLALLSLWTDAQARRALPEVDARFPGVELQGKGLLATEGVVTLPLFEAPAPVLAVRSHHFEFLDPVAPDSRPRLAHEVEMGKTYEIVLSTGAGILRYRLGDLVRVEGFLRATPCLRFLGRADAVSDLVGEKLSAARVGDVLARVLGRLPARETPRFAMLAPEWRRPPAYHLFIESEASDPGLERIARGVEEELLQGFAYRYARDLGQLGPVAAVRVRDGLRRYEARCILLGQRAGNIKPADLHLQPGWTEHLSCAGEAIGSIAAG